MRIHSSSATSRQSISSLHNHHHACRSKQLPLLESHFHLQPHLGVLLHRSTSHGISENYHTILYASQSSQQFDDHDAPFTSQGIFHTQPQRRANCASRSKGHQQWLAQQHRMLPSRHRRRKLTSAKRIAHREEEFTSMTSGEPSYGGKADIRRKEIDIHEDISCGSHEASRTSRRES